MKNRKKILITASTFPRYDGDTEPRFILDLAKELSKYFCVTVLAPASADVLPSETLEGITVERYHYFPIHKLETLCYPGAIVPRIKEKKVRILLVPFLFIGMFIAIFKRRKKYDAVHANWIIPQGIIQCMFNMPYVLTGHGGDVTSLNIQPIKAIKKKAIKKASYITVVSEELKEELLSLLSEYERQLCIKKIKVAPMGCNLMRFSELYRKPFFWNQGEKKVVLYVGRLAEKKGVKYLIEAMQWVDAMLVIVGKGPLERELVRIVQDLGLEDRVTFMGAKTHDELPAIYASADVFVAPSITAKDNDKEGFGLVILEAMASGVPVVASRSGGIIEIIEDGKNGSLVNEKDSKGLSVAINKMLYNTEYRKGCVEKMKDTVEKYSYDNVGMIYKKIFDDILN